MDNVAEEQLEDYEDFMAGDMVCTVLYWLLAMCFVAPPSAFISAGLTVQNVFSEVLGSEDLNFVMYHIKRTSITALLHSLLPLGYFVTDTLFTGHYQRLVTPSLLPAAWRWYLALSLALPLGVSLLVLYWRTALWARHPLARKLSLHAPPASSWHSVMSSVNIEFRRIDKFSSGAHGRRLYVTDSWVLQTSAYTVEVAHQADVHLTLDGAEQHQLSHVSSTGVQVLSITVRSVKVGVRPFRIRLDATEYGDLREKLQSPVRNAHDVVIQQTVSERFMEAFRAQARENKTYRRPRGVELENCIGCMRVEANVTLVKRCDDSGHGSCSDCFCRPMWCLDCLGKWFASRQLLDEAPPERWMSCQAPCPTCRSTFCTLDVCRIT